MSSLPETVTCGSAREVIKNFLRKQPEGHRNLTKEEQTRVALAFHHAEMCWYGNDMPNFCNDLWKELQTMTWERDENGDPNARYDPQVALYMIFAQYPLHDELGTEENPLKNLKW